MGANNVTKSSISAATLALAILCGIALPSLANSSQDLQDKLAMNTGASPVAQPKVQDTQVKQAVDTIRAFENPTIAPIKAKKLLRHNYKSAGNILILGGAEAFPM